MAEVMIQESKGESGSESERIARTLCRQEGHSINVSLGHELLCTKCGKDIRWIRGEKSKEDGNGKGS